MKLPLLILCALTTVFLVSCTTNSAGDSVPDFNKILHAASAAKDIFEAK